MANETESNSRDAILAAIRRFRLPESPLPELEGDWIQYEDLPEQFASMVAAVGGSCLAVNNKSELADELAKIEAFASADRVFSACPDVGRNDIDLDAVSDPQTLDGLDFAILSGEFGVAENGAIWVTDAGLRHRAVYFMAEHLALVLPLDQIVNNMHEAYERLSFIGPHFGCFISGPSKTADIEQSLVIGAQGPRSLTVMLIKNG